jgi:hypothetical protein
MYLNTLNRKVVNGIYKHVYVISIDGQGCLVLNE